MFAVGFSRMRILAVTALAVLLAIPAGAFQQPAFREALRPPQISSGGFQGAMDGSYPTILLPLEVARVSGNINAGTLPFGTEDLSYNMTCRQDTLGAGDVVCRGSYLSPRFRVYRRTLNRGYIHAPGLHSLLRVEADSTFTEIEAGSNVEFHYDANGRLERIQDPNARAILITRNTAGKVTQVSDGSGRSISFTYNGDLITQASFSAGGSISYEYLSTPNGQRLSRMTNLADDVSTWAYDSAGQLISSSDPASGNTTYEIDQATMTVTVKDSDGTVISTTRIDTTSNFSATSFNSLGLGSGSISDFRGLTTKETTSRGRIAASEYDAERNPILVRKNFDTIVMRYSDFGALTQVSSSIGETTSYAYDSKTRLVLVSLSSGDSESFWYDTFGNILFHRLPNGGLFSHTYDVSGNRATSQDPDGVVTEFDYNSIGFVTVRKGCSTCGGAGPSSYFAYNGYGYLTSTGNGLDTTSIIVDSVGRQLVLTLPGGGKRLMSWTAAGPASISNSVTGETVTYAYRSGRLVSMLDAIGAKSEFTNSSSGNLVIYKSPLGDLTSYGYDSAANFSGVAFPTNPSGSPIRTYTSDSQDRLVKNIRETDDVIDYVLDASGRLVQRKANGSAVATLTYDSRGFVSRAEDPLGAMTYLRNALGQATSVSHPSGVILSYEYTEAGRVKHVAAGNYSSDIGFDSHGQLSSIGTEAGNINFTYDSSGRTSTLMYPNGVVAIFSYGPMSATSRIEYRNVGGDTIIFSIVRDSMSKITNIYRSDLNETMAVGYSPRGEIVRTDIHRPSDTLSFSYTYDSSGNRTRYVTNSETINYVYAPGNLLDSGSADYNYNLAGEVTGIGSRSITYTAEGMLRTDTTSLGTVTYDYDAFGRRQRSVVGGIFGWRLWDEAQNEIADVDGSGHVTEFRYFDPDIMDEMYGFTRDSRTYFTLADPIGNIAIVVDENANVEARYAYDPFQLCTNDSFDSIDNSFRFASRREEASGEIFVRERSLEAATGRFMQRDPLILGGEDDQLSWNLFAYAHNDAINFDDPTGLDPYANCAGRQENDNLVVTPVHKYHWKPKDICHESRYHKNGNNNQMIYIYYGGVDAHGHECPDYSEPGPIIFAGTDVEVGPTRRYNYPPCSGRQRGQPRPNYNPNLPPNPTSIPTAPNG